MWRARYDARYTTIRVSNLFAVTYVCIVRGRVNMAILEGDTLLSVYRYTVAIKRPLVLFGVSGRSTINVASELFHHASRVSSIRISFSRDLVSYKGWRSWDSRNAVSIAGASSSSFFSSSSSPSSLSSSVLRSFARDSTARGHVSSECRWRVDLGIWR